MSSQTFIDFKGLGYNIEQVLAIRDAAMKGVTDGKIVVQSTVGESSFAFQIPEGLGTADLLYSVKRFLQKADPATYGPCITTHRVNFNTGYFPNT